MPEAATICLNPLQVDNIFVFILQVAPVPACWLFKTSALTLDIRPSVVLLLRIVLIQLLAAKPNKSIIIIISNKLTFDLESDVRVTCDAGYLCQF